MAKRRTATRRKPTTKGDSQREIMKDIHVDVPGQSEDALQQKCFFWFWNEYPELRGLLFSVPNGGVRTAREGAKLKRTGLTPGVSDLILLHKGKPFLIELKVENGFQSDAQGKWQKTVETNGFIYFIVWSLQEFKDLIKSII